MTSPLSDLKQPLRAHPQWFLRLCPPDRLVLREPVQVTIRGKRWRIAVNGTAITALPGRLRAKGTAQVSRDMLRILAAPPRDMRLATPQQLAAFLLGVGDTARDLEGEPELGVVAPGVVINRCLLKRFMGPLHSKAIKVCTGKQLDPVHFIGDGWHVVVMPMRLAADAAPRLFPDSGSVPYAARPVSFGRLATDHCFPGFTKQWDRAVRSKLSKARAAGKLGRRL